jgi:hypothetical protein
MKTLRIFALTSLVAGFGLMTSCNTTASGDAPSISSAIYVSDHQSDLATFVFQANNTYHLAGTVQNVSSWSWTIENSSGTVETISAAAPSGSGSTDIGSGNAKLIAFTPKSSWGATGSYSIKGVLTGTDGSTLTTKLTFQAAPGGTTTPTGTTTTISSQGGPFTIGAQKADSASFISVTKAADFATITSGGKTAADEANIDVIFFADNSGTPSFFSPAEAKAQGLGKVSSWSTWNNTVIVSAGSTALSTVEAAKALTDNSSSHSVAVTANTWYAIKLDNSKGYGAIHILTLSGNGQSASATISLFE